MVCILLSGAAGAELRAGAAKADITPDVQAMRVPLGGYAGRKGTATGVRDRVFARALALSDGEKSACIVSVDLCFVPANVKAEVVKRVRAAGLKGLTAENLMLAATHTHAAPDPLAMHAGNTFTHIPGWSAFDAKLLEFICGKIAEAILAAHREQEPVALRSAVARLSGLNRNRRGGPKTDTEMTLLQIAGKRHWTTVAVFAAHPTLYDEKMMEVSADWPGRMTARMEEQLAAYAQPQGGRVVSLFLNGAEGDVTTQGAEGKTAEERVADYGRKVADWAVSLARTAAPGKTETLAAWTQPVTLPPRRPNALFVLAAGQLGLSVAQARQFVTQLMPTQTVIGFVRIGDVLLMGFPCEPTTELGLAAKELARKAGFPRAAVVALANDWLGYALTPEEYRQGEYEATMSFYGDPLGPALLAAIKKGLHSRPKP